MIRYPDFYCIGAQKAGTTWLHAMLRQHSGIWLPPLKELHYFDRLYLKSRVTNRTKLTKFDQEFLISVLAAVRRHVESDAQPREKMDRIIRLSLIGQANLNDRWYGRIFGSAPRATICGEICPAYALIPEDGVQHMMRLKPGAKVIFIIRDPIERAWSHMRMDESTGRLKPDRYLHWIAKNEPLFVYSDYMATIERFLSYTAPETMLVLYFDDIIKQPQQILADTCTFLGVEATQTEFKNMEKAANIGNAKDAPPEVYSAIRDRLEPVYKRLLALNSPAVARWYKAHYSD